MTSSLLCTVPCHISTLVTCIALWIKENNKIKLNQKLNVFLKSLNEYIYGRGITYTLHLFMPSNLYCTEKMQSDRTLRHWVEWNIQIHACLRFVKGAPCRFGEEIQTQHFNICNINEVQTTYKLRNIYFLSLINKVAGSATY